MKELTPLNPVPHKITGNRVIISQEVFLQLVSYANAQTNAINTLMSALTDLTKTVKQLTKIENDHYNTTVSNIETVKNDTNASLETLQTQVSTLAKSISIFLGGE